MAAVLQKTPKKLKQAKKDELSLREAAQKGNFDQVEKLIFQGVNVNARAEQGKDGKSPSLRTALHWAAKYKHKTIVQLLLKVGANQALEDRDKKTPLDLARAETDNEEVIKILEAQSKYISPQTLFESENRTVLPIESKQFLIILKRYQKQNDVFRENCKIYLEKLMKELSQRIPEICKRLFNRECDLINLTAEETSKLREFLDSTMPHQIVQNHLHFLNTFFSTDSPVNIAQTREVDVMFATIIIEKLRFQRAFAMFKEKSITTWKPFLKRESIRKFRNILNKIEQLSDQQFNSYLETTENSFRNCIHDPKDLVKTLDIHFKGDLLDTLCMHAYLSTNPSLLRLKKLSEFDRAAFDIIMEGYHKEMLDSCKNIIFRNERFVSKMAALNTTHIPHKKSIEMTQKVLISMVEKELRDTLSRLKKDPKPYPLFIFYSFWVVSRKFWLNLNSYVTSAEAFSMEDYSTRSAAIRKEFLDELEVRAKYNSGFETIRANEKRAAKNKESEERASLQEEKLKTEALLWLKKEADAKLKQESEIKLFYAKGILSNLSEKRDADTIDLIANILSKKITQISQDQFFALMTKLKISGYENIHAGNTAADNNKLTFKLGKDNSFTLHVKHGKDKSDMVDKATIQEFRALLEKIGITQANFSDLCTQFIKKDAVIPHVSS